MSVSIGVASAIPKLADAPAVLVHQADAALYAEKRAGRNQVRLAAPTK